MLVRVSTMRTNHRAKKASALWLDSTSFALATKNVVDYIPFWAFWNRTWTHTDLDTEWYGSFNVYNMLKNSWYFLGLLNEGYFPELSNTHCKLHDMPWPSVWQVTMETGWSPSCETNTCPIPCISLQTSPRPSQLLSLSLPHHLKPYLDAGRMPTMCKRNSILIAKHDCTQIKNSPVPRSSTYM